MTTKESILRAALALARECILVIDVETLTYLEFNDAMCRMTGRTREELERIGPVGMWAATGGTPQALRRHYDELIAQSPTPLRHRTPVHRPDGSMIEVWMDRQARLIDGRWVIVICASEVEAGGGPAERDLESLRAEMHASSDAISLIDYQAMRYLDVNQAACEVLGYSREELLEGEIPLSGDRTLEDMQELYAGLVMRSPEAVTEDMAYTRSDGVLVPGRATRQAVLAGGQWVIYVRVAPAGGGAQGDRSEEDE